MTIAMPVKRALIIRSVPAEYVDAIDEHGRMHRRPAAVYLTVHLKPYPAPYINVGRSWSTYLWSERRDAARLLRTALRVHLVNDHAYRQMEAAVDRTDDATTADLPLYCGLCSLYALGPCVLKQWRLDLAPLVWSVRESPGWLVAVTR